MDVIILAAGYATRLYPLTENTPKPLLEVAGKPMVEHILSKIKDVDGVDRIHIVTNDKFHSHFQEWLENFEFEKQIQIVNDGSTNNDDRKGAVGDVHFTIQTQGIADDVLVIAGDNLFEVSLKDFVSDSSTANSIVLYDVKEKELAKHYGVVKVENNIVAHFQEKPENPDSTLVSTGIYLFPKSSLELINTYITEGHSPDKTGEFIEWLHTKEDIRAFVTDKTWYDIGSLDQLEEANKHYSA